MDDGFEQAIVDHPVHLLAWSELLICGMNGSASYTTYKGAVTCPNCKGA